MNLAYFTTYIFAQDLKKSINYKISSKWVFISLYVFSILNFRIIFKMIMGVAQDAGY